MRGTIIVGSLLLVLAWTASSEEEAMCERAVECRWFGRLGANYTWRALSNSARLKACKALSERFVSDAKTCRACNEARACKEGPCPCLREVIEHDGLE